MKEVSISSELESRQQDELNSIESIYGDIFKDITPKELIWNKKPNPHFQVFLSSSENTDNPTVSITLDIEFTPTYPLSSPKVKFLNPQNLLRAHVARLKQKSEELIKEYKHEEVSFAIISESKFILDDIQAVTMKVLSLEEEREERLRNERKALEELEAKQQQELESASLKRSAELSKQIQQIKTELDEEVEEEEEEEEVEVAPIPNDKDNYFIFDNELEDYLPHTRRRYRFKAVQGFIRYTKRSLFSSIGKQFIVKPYVSDHIRAEADKQGHELNYLLTEIDLNNQYWQQDAGKSEVQDLEKELQSCVNLNNPHIVKLIGFQIDKQNGWKVRLLTEFSFVSESLFEIMPSKGHLSLAIARIWLMDLIPVLEQLHNSGLIHKQINPFTIFLLEQDRAIQGNAFTDSSTANSFGNENGRIIKLAHPSYGYRLLRMVETHPNAGSDKFRKDRNRNPDSWTPPEVKQTGIYNQKSDVWDLGVLVLRLVIGKDALVKEFPTPDEFFKKFFEKAKFDGGEYGEQIYDLLTKLLQPKYSKRPTLLELNAVKFLRDGPVLKKQSNYGFSGTDNVANNRVTRYDSVRVPGDVRGSQVYNSSGVSLGSESRGNSRYERDFEEIGRLGKGGFGDVVKARNRMEGTFYAIKKIKHRANKLDSLLSEVLSLARLNHQYIVRYYGTWVEELGENTKAQDEGKIVPVPISEVDSGSSDEVSETEDESDLSYINRSSSLLAHRTSSFQVDYISNSFDPRIDFDDGSLQPHSNTSEDVFEFAHSTEAESISQESASISSERGHWPQGASTVSTEKKATQTVYPRSILYIQMEFCENNTLLNLIEQGLPNNPNEYWRLFRQLLEAVSYIHSEGFIHRDLKPMNIFIDKSNNIKVGDFGLAKNSQFLSAVPITEQISEKVDAVTSKNGDLSTVVGTVFYTAPEVSSGHYDEKVDLFSLGVIFFEMCYSLSTGMERALTLNKLRQREYPENWKSGQEKQIVHQLLDPNPKARPGATELLQSGQLPVEHQDQVIREALKSLADPASPWQQQVREALFNQQYSLAKDLLFDSNRETTSSSASDYLLFNKIVQEITNLFHRHGAVENQNINLILPRVPTQPKNQVYEFLDRGGSVVTLPYDLVVPVARFVSKNEVNVPKFYRHDFVYRPSLRGIGMPEKYSAMNFNISSNSDREVVANDAECLKIADEVLHLAPQIPARKIIFINHYDILDAVVSFVFGNTKLDEQVKWGVFAVLSQLGIDKSVDDVKKYLREEFQVPRTVIEDLLSNFNFTCSLHEARQKLQKLMIDSTQLMKVEKSFAFLSKVQGILNQFGKKSEILFNPLYNYDNRYYRHGIMFQAVFKGDKSKRYSRLITGGRFDALVRSFTDVSVTGSHSFKPNKLHCVGFTLSTSFLFALMKSIISRKFVKNDFTKWKGSRCDVLVSSTQQEFVDLCGYEILGKLWSNGISADLVAARSLDDLLHEASVIGASWIVLVRQGQQLARKARKSSNFKPLKVKNVVSGKDVDLDSYDELVHYLREELGSNEDEIEEEATSEAKQSDFDTSPIEQLDAIDLNQKIIVVNNEAPRGRKNNKREKWEVETNAKTVGSQVVQKLAQGPVLTFDIRDEVVDMIGITSIHQQEEWVRKVLFSSNNLPKSFAMNIYSSLVKEASKGHSWCILVASRTSHSAIVDLRR
ncbi:GCN2 [Candida theae]|uniref:non-specific serine/threonine protein kinase n=1 Tax=Candida theae TaxID=1198502 RepID=A0AAD5BCV7_9ASCO|nr:GCN2 [Candida theae]KAI5955992.1 GCN2 [Candida theae]